MTLNLTAIFPDVIVQASDRRMSWNGRPVDDKANKALVLSCEDGVIGITFTGLGRYGNQRVDLWLGEILQDAGAPELPCRTAAKIIQEKASDWFKSINVADKRHAFVLAGWEGPVGARKPIACIVTNCAADQSSFIMLKKAREQFQLISPVRTKESSGVCFGTGLIQALPRIERRRLKAELPRSGSVERIEDLLARSIQAAADSPKWAWGIGKECMSVAIAPEGVVRARLMAPVSPPHEYGPGFIWNSGGMNCFAADIECVPIPGFYEFGNAQFSVGKGSPLIDPKAGDCGGIEANVKWRFRITESKLKKGSLTGRILAIRGLDEA